MSEMRAETSTSSESVLSRSEDMAPPLSASSTTTHISRLSNKGSRSPSYDMESPCVGRERSGKERIIGGKNIGSPPTGVVKCARCQTTHSPEWRKGPSGKKDLCNAYVSDSRIRTHSRPVLMDYVGYLGVVLGFPAPERKRKALSLKRGETRRRILPANIHARSLKPQM